MKKATTAKTVVLATEATTATTKTKELTKKKINPCNKFANNKLDIVEVDEKTDSTPAGALTEENDLATISKAMTDLATHKGDLASAYRFNAEIYEKISAFGLPKKDFDFGGSNYHRDNATGNVTHEKRPIVFNFASGKRVNTNLMVTVKGIGKGKSDVSFYLESGKGGKAIITPYRDEKALTRRFGANTVDRDTTEKLYKTAKFHLSNSGLASLNVEKQFKGFKRVMINRYNRALADFNALCAEIPNATEIIEKADKEREAKKAEATAKLAMLREAKKAEKAKETKKTK